MGLISRTIPGAFGGVSQVVPELRKINEVEKMENCYSQIGYGTTARPKLNKKLTFPFTISDNFSKIISHEVNDEVIDFLYIINSDTLYIYNLDTYDLQDSFTDTYFIGLNNKTGRIISSGKGNVYILNTTKEISLDNSINSDSDTEYSKLIYVKTAVRPGNYEINNGSDSCNASIPIDTVGNSISLTNDICKCLFNGSNVGDFTYNGYSGGLSTLISGIEERSGSIIYYENGVDLTNLVIEDSVGNNAIQIIDKKVDSFGKLPPNMKHPVTIEVTGQNTEDESSIYYKYIDGSWKESYKVTYVGDDEIYRGFDNNDMPRVIKNDGLGGFTNNIENYKNREIGNDTNNPLPLFVNNKINDMFIYQNRLCFLSDNGISFSEIGDFTNFFRNTVRTLINFDAFNYKVEVNNGLTLKHSLLFNNSVILFDKNNQYNLMSKGVLGSNDIYVVKSTSFKNNLDIKPITVNNKLYFTNNRNNKSNIYQLSDNKINDITIKVPNYVSKDLQFISSVNLFNLTFFGSGDNEVFIFNDNGFSKWIFGDNIKNIHNTNEKDLYFITQKCLYNMNLDNLGGSNQFGNIDDNFIDDTDNDLGYTYLPLVELSKIYIPSQEIQGLSLPQGNYRLKQINMSSYDNCDIVITDSVGSYESQDDVIELQSDLKETKIEIKANNVGFYFTSISIDMLYTDETINNLQ